ncbi:PIN domain-containing protein [Oscillospiraceae bacterium 50-16]|jgi:predicted nucleic acid-binding protein|nr:PIN domain-containing protein [Oscillospiraceae bacterium]RKJ56462.1 PIN domain-containing protein [bacterium 1XD42-8]RKJ64817.1 PIN domain-containing protein [bacterium 1XD42-1]
MVVLIDTNVALDFLTVRQPFYQSAKAILKACASDNVQGYIAFHSLPNIFYILRKSYTDEDRRSMLEKLCLILRVTGASHERVCDAISRGEFSDFEDCLQDECAQEVSADYIVTRNVDDFNHSRVQAITPEEFLQRDI